MHDTMKRIDNDASKIPDSLVPTWIINEQLQTVDALEELDKAYAAIVPRLDTLQRNNLLDLVARFIHPIQPVLTRALIFSADGQLFFLVPV